MCQTKSQMSSRIAFLLLVTAFQQFSSTAGFLFPDLKLHPDTRSGGSVRPRYRIAVIQEEPYLFANGSGYIPDLMRHLAQTFQMQHNGEEFLYELVPVANWNALLSKARAPRGQVALGMVIPSLELSSWPSRSLRSSVPTLYTTLKLVVSKHKATEWSANGDALPDAVEPLADDNDLPVQRNTVQLSARVPIGVKTSGRKHAIQPLFHRGRSNGRTKPVTGCFLAFHALFKVVKIVVLRGSPAEYLLVRANGYRGPMHLAETADEAVNFLMGTSEEAVMLTDAVVADYIANKYPSDMESVCPSRLTGSGWIFYSFFGRDERTISKLNQALAPFISDDSLLGLFSKHITMHAASQSPQQCLW